MIRSTPGGNMLPTPATVPLPRSKSSPRRKIITIESGTAIAAARMAQARAARPGGRSANHTPGAPSPSIASEIERNAKWYQRTTLRIRVIATW